MAENITSLTRNTSKSNRTHRREDTFIIPRGSVKLQDLASEGIEQSSTKKAELRAQNPIDKISKRKQNSTNADGEESEKTSGTSVSGPVRSKGIRNRKPRKIEKSDLSDISKFAEEKGVSKHVTALSDERRKARIGQEEASCRSILEIKLPPLKDNSRSKVSVKSRNVQNRNQMMPIDIQTTENLNLHAMDQTHNGKHFTPQPLPRLKKSVFKDNNATDPVIQDVSSSALSSSRPFPKPRILSKDPFFSSISQSRGLTKVKRQYSDLSSSGKEEGLTSVSLSYQNSQKNVLENPPKRNSVTEEIGSKMEDIDQENAAKFTIGKKVLEKIPSADRKSLAYSKMDPSRHIGKSERKLQKPLDLFNFTPHEPVQDEESIGKEIIRNQTRLVREKRNELSLSQKLEPIA